MAREAIVLGCGTSHGVPMIGCNCKVCKSEHPRNKRTRSAIVLRLGEDCRLQTVDRREGNGCTVLVDAPPELRLQLTREDIGSVDFMILTHGHADHIMGLDDVRRFNELTGKPMTIYAQPKTQELIREAFGYAFRPPDQEGGGLPSYDLMDALDQIGEIEMFPVMHGVVEVLAVKVGGFAYLTDVSEIPAEAARRLAGLDTLILDATRYAPHPSHLHFDAAVELALALGARRTYLTHLSHDYDYEEVNSKLPPGIELSYDGLRIPIAPS